MALSARVLLAKARAAGFTLRPVGGLLAVEGDRPASTPLLHALGGAKTDLLALLEAEADEAAERDAIRSEAPLPPVGSPERERLDQAHRAMLAGLLAAARLETNSN